MPQRGRAIIPDQDGVKFRGERHRLALAESELGCWHDVRRPDLKPLSSRDGGRARGIRTTSDLRPLGRRNKDATEQLVQEVEVPDAG